ESALLPPLGDEDPHAPSGSFAQPRLERLALVGLCWNVDLRRRAADLIELLHRRNEDLRFRRSDDRIVGAELDAFDDTAPAYLEHLDYHARWTELHAKDVPMPLLDGRHLLLTIVERLHGPHRIA